MAALTTAFLCAGILLLTLYIDTGSCNYSLLRRPSNCEGRQSDKRYVLHQERLSWFEALGICQADGGTLAFPATCRIKNELRAIIASQNASLQSELHGGFFRPDYFVTVFGSPSFDLGYQRWEVGQEKPQVCGTYNHDILLYDAKCTDRRRFICEYSATTEKKINITSAPLLVERQQVKKYKPTRSDGPFDAQWKDLVQQGRMHWYKVFDVEKRWSVAKATCEVEGSHLLILNHQYEANTLRDHVQRNHPKARGLFYVGLRNGNNSFLTLTGSAVPDGWEYEQPEDETCLAVNPQMLLTKVPCWQPHSFICEMTLTGPEDL